MTATFGPREAAHLLRRLQFGVLPEEIDRAVRDGREAVLDRLFTPQPESATFQAAQTTLRDTALATSSIQDLKAWWLYRMAATANPVREKLTLLWHNHFATSYAKVNSAPMMAAQNDLFRALGGGPFGTLLHAVARDPAMLVWLDGNANRKRHPNENFAREVMELFALGLGHYTEKDIQEAARAFSGWHLHDGQFWFNEGQHDDSPKTIFGQTGNFEGTAVIDLCVEHAACPRFLAFKLCRAFVMNEPSPAWLDRVAATFRQRDLQTAAVLREVCTWPEFYADDVAGAIIKSPVELVLGTLRSVSESIRWPAVCQLLAKLGQDVFEPPSVKGWDGGRQWIHATAWILRWNFLTEAVGGNRYGPVRSSVRDLAAKNAAAWQTALFAVPLSAEAQTALKEAGRDWLPTALALPEYQLM